MKRVLITLAATLAVLAASAGAAFAGGPVQSATQSADTDQAAIAASSATQVQPSNENISVRVLSPGDDGTVSQSNEASSSADASNTASTTQNTTQTSAGCGCVVKSGNLGDVLGTALQAAGDPPATEAAAPAPTGTAQTNDAASTGTSANAAPTTQTASQGAPSGGGVQSSTQDADTKQAAVAKSSAEQIKPSNENISVRVLSPGNDGNVRQSNEASSDANATNSATTTQGSTQSGGGSGVQAAKQDADTKQAALAESSAKQVHPENTNVSVRVLSPGNNGSVSQENEAESSATAKNTAPVTQSATQNQLGDHCGCEGTGKAVQSVGQDSDVWQGAKAASSATQIKPSNDNEPIRIKSWGDNGSVKQENSAESEANASNTAPVMQTATQNQLGDRCGCEGTGKAVQAVGQDSDVWQGAKAASSATQIAPSNVSEPVRIKSSGNDGSLKQENEAESEANASNNAPVTQTATQQQAPASCGCSSGHAVEALGQSSKVGQLAVGLSSAKQIGATNESSPVRIWSKGDGGFVSQENSAESSADASNNAPVSQTGRQAQSGSGIQALGQDSKVGQLAYAASSAEQLPGRSRCGCEPSFGNFAGPVRIWSDGNDGSVKQENEAESHANASNNATPTQTGTQTQTSPSCKCSGLGIQALGQYSTVDQLAAALSSAKQIGATNKSAPARVWSPGGDGKTWQSNEAESESTAPNVARILQAGQQMMV
jgi:hypothetical protein